MSLHAAGQPHIAESSSASFHHLLTVPVPLALVDEDAHILAANTALAAMLDADMSALSGKTLAALNSQTDNGSWDSAQFTEFVRQGKTYTTSIKVGTEPARWLAVAMYAAGNRRC
jgi:nitrogen-specific signal transduction histidine kinase